MSDDQLHDLHDFMQQVTAEISAEYSRIRKRASEDPGTAGDQGEENWAELLRGWLPRNYEVVTKGRMISQDGVTSPQIDVLVLNGAYPEKLLNKKLYLAAGVAAAFECKTTLTAAHVKEAIATCKFVKNMYPRRTGSPYEELHAPIVYGLLAHSHSWKGQESTPEDNIERSIENADRSLAEHPREQLDLICVADLAMWASNAGAYIGPSLDPDWDTVTNGDFPHGAAYTGFQAHKRSHHAQPSYFTPIGALISQLTVKLAWEDSLLRGLSEYYRSSGIAGAYQGVGRMWNSREVYSKSIWDRVESGHLTQNVRWDKWGMHYP